MKPSFKQLISIIAIIIGGIILGKFHPGNVTEPLCNRYTTDEKIFLKTYYLVKQGIPYHQAMSQAVICEAGNISLGSDVFTWRPPAVFYFWTVLTNSGSGIKILFWILTLVTFFCWFNTIKQQSNKYIAAAAIICIIPYFVEHFSYPTGFLMTEWWAVFALSLCANFFSHKKTVAAVICLTIGVLIRELLIVPFLAIAVYYVKKREYRSFIIGCLLFLIGYFSFHIMSIDRLVGQNTPFLITQAISRFHFPEIASLWRMSAFFTQQYPFLSFHSVRILWACGVTVLCWKYRQWTEVSLIILSLIVVLPWMVTGAWTDYWGILFMPLPLLFAPLLPYYLYYGKKKQI